LAYAIVAHCFTCSKQAQALLVQQSPVDDPVGIDNAAQIYRAAGHPKSFISLDTADQMLSNPTDADYAGSITGWRLPIAAWCTAP
jgi:putative redox protein